MTTPGLLALILAVVVIAGMLVGLALAGAFGPDPVRAGQNSGKTRQTR